MPSRRDNREALNRLFQGYIKDYGNVAGWQIMRIIIDEIGGLRLTVPKRRCNGGSLCSRLSEEFGEASAKAIVDKIITDLGGLRVRIPSAEYLYREERNRKIRERYNGSNANELALQWNITPSGVRKIVREG